MVVATVDAQTMPLLGRLGRQDRDYVLQKTSERLFRKGEMLFESGQRAESVFIIVRGLIYLIRETPAGQSVVVDILSPQEVLCGISALDHEAYSTGALAASDVEVLDVPSQAFAQLIRQSSETALRVLSACCDRIRHLEEANSIAMAPVPQRLAFVLLRLHRTFGDTIPATHRELAQMAGTRLETSIRTLADFKRQGWLVSSRGRITLLNPKALSSLFGNGNAS